MNTRCWDVDTDTLIVCLQLYWPGRRGGDDQRGSPGEQAQLGGGQQRYLELHKFKCYGNNVVIMQHASRPSCTKLDWVVPFDRNRGWKGHSNICETYFDVVKRVNSFPNEYWLPGRYVLMYYYSELILSTQYYLECQSAEPLHSALSKSSCRILELEPQPGPCLCSVHSEAALEWSLISLFCLMFEYKVEKTQLLRYGF